MVVANDADEPLTLLGAMPATMSAGMRVADVTDKEGGERHTQTMAYKLVACPAPAASCEVPSDWDE